MDIRDKVKEFLRREGVSFEVIGEKIMVKQHDKKTGIPTMVAAIPSHIVADAKNAGYKAEVEYLSSTILEFFVENKIVAKEHRDEVRRLKKAIKKTAKEQYGRGIVDAQKKAQETISKIRSKKGRLTEEVLLATSAAEASRKSLKMAKDNWAIQVENYAETLRSIKTALGSLKSKSKKEDIIKVIKKVLGRC